MDIGDRVIAYTHEGSDYTHSVIDKLAFVVGLGSEDCVDVVIFPAKGPVEFKRLCLFNPDKEVVGGGTYWREAGASPPDFTSLDHTNKGEWTALIRTQREEYAALGKQDPSKLEALAAEHLKQRQELKAELDVKYQRVEVSAEVSKPKAKPPEPWERHAPERRPLPPQESRT